jgi:hypothetical protein
MKLEIKRGSSRASSLENSLWKRLWTFRKTLRGGGDDNDDIMNKNSKKHAF